MGYGAVYSRAALGVAAPSVQVEVRLSGGLPTFQVTGAAEGALRDLRDRVHSALSAVGHPFPQGRITVNLAPADLPKRGARFDLPVALALLQAQGLGGPPTPGCEFLGELSLDGALRPIVGALPALEAAAEAGRILVLPEGNGAEAGLFPAPQARLAPSLAAVLAWLKGTASLPPPVSSEAPPPEGFPSLSRVQGQVMAKRALALAAVGGHNLLMVGPPGSGKTLIAESLPGLLPPLRDETAREVAMIQSLSSRGGLRHRPRRPFRAPHHSISQAALIGGGAEALPGEVSLAHGGVLFLDELPEFSRAALEALREPLEAGEVVVARARHRARYPARFQLLAAMNPCPAAVDCQNGAPCQCPPGAATRYRARLSGALLDRIDLFVSLASVPLTLLGRAPALPQETTGVPTARTVSEAQNRALARQGCLNARLPPERTVRACAPTESALALLTSVGTTLGLSARGFHRTLRLARSIADLAGEPAVEVPAVQEALAFRPRFSDAAPC